MAKTWLVYAFTWEDFQQGPAKQGLIRTIDPDNRDELLTLKVSDHDCDELDDWIALNGYRSDWVYRVRNGVVDEPVWVEATEDAGIPFEWEFGDPTEVIDRRAMQPPEQPMT